VNTIDHYSLLVQLRKSGGEWVDVALLHHSNETTWFESLRTYWESGDRPILGQVFEERGPSWRPSTRVALPNWFSHLLPEGRLRQAVAAAAHVKHEREFFLLRRIGGDDLPGALRVVPAEVSPSGTVVSPDEVADEKTSVEMAPLKFSLAGLQLKFSLVFGERGLTIPARGDAGEWIAKLPDVRRGFEGVPEAELASLELARTVGISVPEARLVDVDSISGLPEWATSTGGRALLIRRFDRTEGGGRVHFEELAQILGVPTGREHFKYQHANFETVARVTGALCGSFAVGDVVERLVLNVLIGNGDAHTKNWAYRYPDGRTPELSPAYDILPTVLYVTADDLGLKLGGSREFEDVTVRSFERLAEKAGWDAAAGRARALETVARVVDAWHILAEYLPRDAFTRITERRDKLPLLRE
jgi:serine/threonine-protein kinase HipA